MTSSASSRARSSGISSVSILNQDASLAAPRTPVEDRPRRLQRRWTLLVAAGAVLAALAAGLVVATRKSQGGLSTVPPNHVGVIDPSLGEVVAAVPVGIRPGPITFGLGSIWVGNVDDRSLTRIDPVHRAAAATISLDRRTPTGVTVGAGSIWVAHGRSGELSRVEPRFGEIARLVVTDRPYAAPYGAVSTDRGLVWAVYGDSTLARIRAPGRLTGSTLTGGSPSGIASGGGTVWVANSGGATVERFDAITFEEGPIRVVSVGHQPVAVALGTGALWVANRADDTVTRIDPDTNASVFTIPVGDEPVAVAVEQAGSGSRMQATPRSPGSTHLERGRRNLRRRQPARRDRRRRWCRLGERAVLLGTTGAGTPCRGRTRGRRNRSAPRRTSRRSRPRPRPWAHLAGQLRIECSVGATSCGARERCGVSQPAVDSGRVEPGPVGVADEAPVEVDVEDSEGVVVVGHPGAKADVVVATGAKPSEVRRQRNAADPDVQADLREALLDRLRRGEPWRRVDGEEDGDAASRVALRELARSAEVRSIERVDPGVRRTPASRAGGTDPSAGSGARRLRHDGRPLGRSRS